MRNIITTTLAVCVSVHLASSGSAEEGLPDCEAPGGIVVYLGNPDLETLKDLHAEGRFTVQALCRDAKRVGDIRQGFSAAGVYGPVSARLLSGGRLPYANDLVNMLVADDTMGLSEEELLRVVCPLGQARFRSGGSWKTVTKPWPDDIDEWTHFRHDPGGNPVAKDDRVGAPRRVQWFDIPRWARSHEFNISMPAMVTARGRVFYVYDKGVTGMVEEGLPEKWTLFARDAFNGKLLWQRPLPNWGSQIWGDRSLRFFKGAMARRLVAIDDRVYCTIDIGAPVHVMDALTGKTLRVIQGTEGASEIVVADNDLFCSTQSVGRDQSAAFKIICHDLKQERTLWTINEKRLNVQTLVAGPCEAIYCNGLDIICVNRTDGSVRWRFSKPEPEERASVRKKRRSVGGGRVDKLILTENKLLLLAWNKLMVLSVEDGKRIWDEPGGNLGPRQRTGPDVFYAGGKIWLFVDKSMVGAYDLETGRKAAGFDVSSVQSYGHHPRCYPAKATSNYIITPYRGVEFLSLKDHVHTQNDWVRGSCTYGVMPANGLLYSPPHPCFCYPGAMFTGFSALARETGDLWAPNAGKPRHGPLENGPAFSTPPSSKPMQDSWPSYRHDTRRTGSTTSRVPDSLARSWEKPFGAHVTQPVVADGRLYVAVKDRHQVVALESASGKDLWTFTVDARIDSSPSIYGRFILFGCADGYLYCVRNSDGALVWRRRMAPAARWIASGGQLESSWRLHGSVLIEGGLAYTCAGRSSFLDGGLFLAAVDIATGNVVHEARLDTSMNTREDRDRNHFVPAFHIEGANSDILTAEGGFIYLNQMKFTPDLKKVPARYLSKEEVTRRPSINLDDKPYINEDIFNLEYKGVRSNYDKLAELMFPTKEGGQLGEIDLGRHLFTTSGFLDDSFNNRTFWMYSATWPGHNHANLAPKSGQMLVIGEDSTYAFKAYTTRAKITPYYDTGTKGYLIVADDNDNDPTLDPRAWSRMMGMGFSRGADPKWHLWLPVRVNAMVKANDKLVVCGVPDVLDEADPLAAFEGRMGSRLWVISAEDGKVISKQELAEVPAFDGMMAAEGRLYMVTDSGKLICMGS